MLGVTGVVIAQRLPGLVEAAVKLRHLRILLSQVVDHRVDFMGEEHPQFLADDLDAQGVDRANDGPMLAVKRL